MYISIFHLEIKPLLSTSLEHQTGVQVVPQQPGQQPLLVHHRQPQLAKLDHHSLVLRARDAVKVLAMKIMVEQKQEKLGVKVRGTQAHLLHLGGQLVYEGPSCTLDKLLELRRRGGDLHCHMHLHTCKAMSVNHLRSTIPTCKQFTRGGLP